MRDLGIRAQAKKERIADVAARGLLAPAPAVAEPGGRSDRIFERNALATIRILRTFALEQHER